MRFLFFALLFVCTAFADSTYFPFAKNAFLTSSFGENRGTRYHAGIDYSTEMQEGWPIFAPENGVVEELRISPYGYGKVLFFKGESGKTWVFAHQSGFSETLDSLVLEKQKTLKQNDVKIYPKVSFRKGDTLSFAGSSGIGNPHLHLEIREGSEIFSPCQNAVACSDTIAPFVFASAVWNHLEFKTTSQEALQNHCIEKPSSKGNLFLAFKIADYSREPLENPMSVRRLSLFSEKRKLYEKIQDTLSYKEMIKIRNELLFAEEADTAGDWHYINASVPKNTDSLFLEVEDFNSNTTTLRLTLQETCSDNQPIKKQLYQDSILYSFLSRAFISFKNCQTAIPLFSKTGKKIKNDLCELYKGKEILAATILEQFPKAYLIKLPEDSIFIQPLQANKKNKWNFSENEIEFELYLPKLESVSWKQALAYKKTKTDSLSYLEFHPKGLHFLGDLKFCVAESYAKNPLYYLGETTRKWFYFSKQNKTKKGLCISMNEMRDVASIIDTTAPAFGNPYWASASVMGKSEPVLRVPVIEKFAGIKNGNAIKVLLKDSTHWIPVEYDSEPKEIVLEKRFLQDSLKTVEIEIEDELQNKAKYEIQIPKKD